MRNSMVSVPIAPTVPVGLQPPGSGSRLLDRDTRPAGLPLGGLWYADLEHSILHAGLDVFGFGIESEWHASVEAPDAPLSSPSFSNVSSRGAPSGS
jgi:hypothetical protein